MFVVYVRAVYFHHTLYTVVTKLRLSYGHRLQMLDLRRPPSVNLLVCLLLGVGVGGPCMYTIIDTAPA